MLKILDLTLGKISNLTAEVPYPDLDLDTPSAGLSTSIKDIPVGSNFQTIFISVQALYVTYDDTLEVLDTGRPMMNEPTAPKMPYASSGGPKLIGISLTTNVISNTYSFLCSVYYLDFHMSDLCCDLRLNIAASGKGIIYIVESSNEGRNGFIVLDLGTGESWRQLNQHPSALRTFEAVH